MIGDSPTGLCGFGVELAKVQAEGFVAGPIILLALPGAIDDFLTGAAFFKGGGVVEGFDLGAVGADFRPALRVWGCRAEEGPSDSVVGILRRRRRSGGAEETAKSST